MDLDGQYAEVWTPGMCLDTLSSINKKAIFASHWPTMPTVVYKTSAGPFTAI